MYLPFASINYGYDRTTDNTLEWGIDSHNSMQIDRFKSQKQDIFVSQSDVYFENKWSLVETDRPSIPFPEYSASSPMIESIKQGDKDKTIYSSMYFRAASLKRQYSMEPYKILTLLGDMGGLLDIIMAFGVMITITLVR